VPTRPAPSGLPDTWQDKDNYPVDKLPLGVINLYAIDHLRLTVPSTLVDPRSPAQPLRVLPTRIRLMREPDPEIRDRAWRYVAELVRVDRADWHLFALSMAYPGLRARITPYVKRMELSWRQAQQVHYTMAIEFIFAMHRLDLSRPWVLSRLLGAAYDQATGRKKRPEPEMVSLDRMKQEQEREEAARQQPPGDPRRVLGRLVRQSRDARDGYRLTERQAALIARTYLAGEKLNDVAASLGLRQSSASKQRARAEYLIALLLDRDDILARITRPDGKPRPDSKPRPDGAQPPDSTAPAP
jgi:hypothetical protein